MSSDARQAKRLLTHYLRGLVLASGHNWDSDNDSEVEEIVDAIIDAAANEGAKRALRALPSGVQE